MNYKEKLPIIVAVAGAKGGVGKSMVCSNLAVQFAQAGLKTTLIDLDLGAANQHTLFGISRSSIDWTEWLRDLSEPLEKYQTPTAQPNLHLLPASQYHPGIAEILKGKINRLKNELKGLKSDLILIDLGAGSHKSTLEIFNLADIKILTTTTESTSLLNNFEFLKNGVFLAFANACHSHSEILPILKSYQYSNRIKLLEVIDQIASKDAFVAKTLTEICHQYNVSVVFNQVRKIEEVEQAVRLKRLVFKQLNIQLDYPGFIFFSEEVVASMQKKLPMSFISPKSVITNIFSRISQHLIERLSAPDDTSNFNKLYFDQIRRDLHKNRVERKKAHHLL